MNVKEIWTPKPMSASGKLVAAGGHIGGFLCTTDGTLKITAGETSGGADIVSQISVTAGTYYPMPFYCQTGAYAVLTSAAGTFAV